MTETPAAPFWRLKSLGELNDAEWESLCDGCGRCCLVKLEDADDGRILPTNVACRLFDGDRCTCRDYPNRTARVPDCLQLTPELVASLRWLPPSCAYRLVHQGEDLPEWHHLKTGSRDSVHEAGASVRGRISAWEDEVAEIDWPEHIVRWPLQWPRQRRTRGKTGA